MTDITASGMTEEEALAVLRSAGIEELFRQPATKVLMAPQGWRLDAEPVKTARKVAANAGWELRTYTN